MWTIPEGRAARLAGPRILPSALAFLCLASLALAQGPGSPRTATKFYPDFSDTADALLRNAASHARDGQWAEAIEIYQRVIQQFGDKVAKLPKDDPSGDPSGESTLYVDLRQFCQRKLAALPPEARAVYRGRVDAQAEGWYRRGAESRDRASLRRVVEEAFCSDWGDDALDLLGDLAFQDGRYDEALASYRQLVPDRADDRAGLVHPDPSVDLARVAAKKLLCRAASGENPPEPRDVEALAKSYPGASGELAGRKGSYAELVKRALAADRLAPPSQPDGRWPTFAGAPTRTKVVPGPIDVGSLQWRVSLKRVEMHQPGHGNRGIGIGAGPVDDDRLLGYHPIVLGDQVIVCDDDKILAYNLNDRPGNPSEPSAVIKEAWKHEEGQGGNAPPAVRFSPVIPRYTLTAHGDRIYARMGAPGLPFLPGMARPALQQSCIVAVDRGTDGKLLWRKNSTEVALPRRPADGINRNVGFEGTPVADARSVYVAMTDRREQTATYVACLDAETGATRWVRYLGAASSELENFIGMGMGMGGPIGIADFGHRLLSLDGPTVYYQTNLGAVVALDAETGGVRWVATYPRQERNGLGQGHERDLNPAVIHDGLVIVAPDDATSIYAFDAPSGRRVWKTKPLAEEIKLAHLLGVAKGRLVATGDRVVLFDVKTGAQLFSWPDNSRAYEGYGRGLLAGDRIYWPTKNEVHVLDQASGLRVEPPIKLRESFNTGGGNLAVGDGYLIVAQPEALVVFCQNSRLIQRYRDEIARAPDQAANYFRLAQAAEATGQDDLALESLGQTLRRSRPSETVDGILLGDAARDHQYRLLMKLGRRSRSAHAWDEATARFTAAARSARSDRERLAARLVLADTQLERGRAAEAVDTLQGLLADDRMRPLNVAAEDGHRTIRAYLLISDRLHTIVRDGGRDLYAEYDRRAHELLERGIEENDPRLLEEIGRAYPVALSAPEALLALGRLYERSRRPSDAAHAYKRLLAGAPGDDLRGRALLGLARSYEAQRLWVPARDAYSQALARFPEVRVDGPGPGGRLADVASERLSRAPFDRMALDRSEPDLAIPLVRRWGRALDGPARPLAAEGVPPSNEAGRVFLVQGTLLRPVDPATGQSPWSADLGGKPVWVGYLADRIIAATESRLVALALAGGDVEWQCDLGLAQDTARHGANPFAGAEGDGNGTERPAGALQGFQVVGGRIFCLRGERELLAIDGDTGLVDWSYSPAAGSINPNVWIGPERVVLQVRDPSAVLVLDTPTGRRRAEHPLSEGEDWARPPLPIDDDHLALVIDRRTVALFDVRRGANAWVFRESHELPKGGPPRLLGDAEHLLVLHDGNELIRLDPATGHKLWARPLGMDDLSERPDSLAFDAGRFYWVSYWANGQTLASGSMADGSTLWSRHLAGPEKGWSIALTERCVMAYPRPSRQDEGKLEELPIVFRRRDTGALVQRLIFPVETSDLAIRLATRGVLVVTQGGLWALGERRAVDGSRVPR